MLYIGAVIERDIMITAAPNERQITLWRNYECSFILLYVCHLGSTVWPNQFVLQVSK
jgi:hypothetical protein